jgi:hypothetical protein
VDYQKSYIYIYIINVSDEKMCILSNIFGCQIGSFPFTYLGLPLKTTKPRIEDFLRPGAAAENWKETSLNFKLTYPGGRLEMVNSMLSALLTFFMGKIKLPPTVIDQIDKYRKHCLLRGADLNAKKPPQATWSLATRPKKGGGLGILNLKTQNDALLLKNLHKFYNKVNCP